MLDITLIKLLRALQHCDKEQKTNMVSKIDYLNTINDFTANFKITGEHFGVYTLNDYFRDIDDEPLSWNYINGYVIYILVTDKEITNCKCEFKNSKFVFYGWIEDKNGEYLCGLI